MSVPGHPELPDYKDATDEYGFGEKKGTFDEIDVRLVGINFDRLVACNHGGSRVAAGVVVGGTEIEIRGTGIGRQRGSLLAGRLGLFDTMQLTRTDRVVKTTNPHPTVKPVRPMRYLLVHRSMPVAAAKISTHQLAGLFVLGYV